MPFYMIKQDIITMEVDAIVNPTDEEYSGGGGTDRHIQKNAGPGLWMKLEDMDLLSPGKATITPGYDLPTKYIIHTQGPRWIDGEEGEEETLAECYRNCLALAEENGCTSIAFPLISGGTFGFPNDGAMRIAQREITEYLQNHEAMRIFLVLRKSHVFNLGTNLFKDSIQFFEDNYVKLDTSTKQEDDYGDLNLREMLREKDETFAVMLDRLREERGLKPSELYHNAMATKNLYSKIMTNMNYHISKRNAVAFGLALKLPWEDFCKLVESAGFAMTRHEKFDVVIEYCVKKGEYDIVHVNELLSNVDPELALIGG